MEYRQLGSTGVRVSPYCLGTYNFGGPTPKAEGVRIIVQALDAGINFVDTANVYHLGGSELVVGQALKGRRDQVVVATKVFNPMGEGPNDRGSSRLALVRECERSLTRLGTDHIDLYQLHREDPSTPLEETLAALDDLVRAGKIRYVGFSNFSAWRIMQARWIADVAHLRPVVSEQPPYNIVERRIEKDVLPACAELGIAVIPYSPLAMGLLSDRFVGGKTPSKARFTQWFSPGGRLWEPAREAVDKLAALASGLGTTLNRLAHAWVRDQPGITAPIIGPRTSTQLKDALASLDLTLDSEVLKSIDQIVAPGQSLWMEIVERSRR